MKNKYFSLLFPAGIIHATTDVLTGMALINDGSLIAGGFFESNISGEKTENSRGSYDYWIVNLDSSHNIRWDKTIGEKMMIKAI